MIEPAVIWGTVIGFFAGGVIGLLIGLVIGGSRT